MAQAQQVDPAVPLPREQAPTEKSGREGVYLALAATGLVIGGALLWYTNGVRVFAELVTGAFYLCF